jgi:hypothetical protein
MRDPNGNVYTVGQKVIVALPTPGHIIEVEKPAQLDPRNVPYERIIVAIEYRIPVGGIPIPLYVLAEPEKPKSN